MIMKKTLLLLSFSLLFVFGAHATKMTEFFNSLDVFYKKYVSGGKVNYGAIKANRSELDKLYTAVGEMTIERAPNLNKKAFYINAYNVCVIKEVVANYPSISGPLKVPGFFDKKKFKVANEYMTLNDLEKVRIKNLGADPRTHFALVCAANGCPKLSSYAYRPEKLERQLNYRTKLTMKDTYFIRVKAGEKKVYVSEIFKWYKDEFVKAEGSILNYINKFRADDSKIPEEYSVDYYTYDWSLNKKK